MLLDRKIKGKYINLRTIEMDDCQQYYLDWLNDPMVNQYLETRWYSQSLETISIFIDTQRKSTDSFLMAIEYNNKHIGNIKIGPIHHIYKCADVSYFLGDKTCWGKGFATEAIKLATDFAFNQLNLHRLQAGVYKDNIGSQKALEKNGYKLESVVKDKYFLHDEHSYCDVLEYVIFNPSWNKKNRYINEK